MLLRRDRGFCQGCTGNIKPASAHTFNNDSLINLNLSFATPGAEGRRSCTRWEAVTEKEAGGVLPENYNLRDKKEREIVL